MAPTHPLVLAAAALACLALAARGRGAAGPGPPWPLRVAARLPVPARMRGPVRRGRTGERIAAAGLARLVDADGIERARAAGALAGAGLGLAPALAHGLAAFAAPVTAMAGALAPDAWLERRARARRAAIVRDLPDLLDLLELSVEAGMSPDPALGLAADRVGGALAEEVEALLEDLALGTPRAAAHRALAARTGAPELAAAMAAVLRAEELGAPLAPALAGQAEALRALRGRAARERAERAAPKIQLVVALVLVPAALVLVLGVLLIELTRQVGGVMGGG